jgi:hypothetical protein
MTTCLFVGRVFVCKNKQAPKNRERGNEREEQIKKMFGSKYLNRIFATQLTKKAAPQRRNKAKLPKKEKVKIIISRSRAAVARRAHNPKVGGSIPPFATQERLRNRSLFLLFILDVLYPSQSR